jgi:hypothetical protein
VIFRVYGKITFECDVCDDVLETDTSSFEKALSALEKSGWESHKEEEGSSWEHHCPNCI